MDPDIQAGAEVLEALAEGLERLSDSLFERLETPEGFQAPSVPGGPPLSLDRVGLSLGCLGRGAAELTGAVQALARDLARDPDAETAARGSLGLRRALDPVLEDRRALRAFQGDPRDREGLALLLDLHASLLGQVRLWALAGSAAIRRRLREGGEGGELKLILTLEPPASLGILVAWLKARAGLPEGKGVAPDRGGTPFLWGLLAGHALSGWGSR